MEVNTKFKCTGDIGFHQRCPLRMDCKFYLDMLDNPAEPFTQVGIKKSSKEILCFKPR